MGIKIKIIIVFLFCIANTLCAQKHNPYQYARLYSLKKCLDINYFALDSLYYKRIPDVTNSLVVQVLSPEQMNEIDDEVRKIASDFYKIPAEGSYDIKNANQIVFSCWEFYQSRNLKKTLKKIVKK